MPTRNLSPIPILTYHQIAQAQPKGAAYRSLSVAPADFSKQMQWLSRLGFQGLSMTALLPYLQGDRVGKVFGITFDDGYLNNLVNAAPVMQRLGFSSTCYVVSQRLGKSNIWDLETGIAQTPLMDAPQLRQWQAMGQEVGAHSRTHARLLKLDSHSAREEIAGSKSDLESLLGMAVNHFCYPYGEYGTEHVAMALESGYQTSTTTQRSRCLAGEAFLQLPRVPVVRRTTRPGLWFKLATVYEDRRRK
ncbi:MAG: polysaccharide deacetylase family protein [Curvibacter sp.]|nr:MAG: polysaccharide deacetylase family protein [Curvibacter sp.]